MLTISCLSVIGFIIRLLFIGDLVQRYNRRLQSCVTCFKWGWVWTLLEVNMNEEEGIFWYRWNTNSWLYIGYWGIIHASMALQSFDASDELSCGDPYEVWDWRPHFWPWNLRITVYLTEHRSLFCSLRNNPWIIIMV